MDHGTGIRWTWWPGSKGETLTTIRGCLWAKWQDDAGVWHPYETCKSCYAQSTAHSLVTRFDQPQYRGLTEATSKGPIWNGNVRFDEEQLLSILSMTKPRTFFLTSVGDLLYGTTDNTVAYHVAVGILAHWHRVLILTKRPDRLAHLWASGDFWDLVNDMVAGLWSRVSKNKRPARISDNGLRRPDNIWLGTSIEGPGSAKWALDHLTSIDHPGRLWTSYEPMIEYVDLRPWLAKLAWVVLGGASKQGPRDPWPFSLDAAEGVVQACASQGVPLFLKQLGAAPTSAGRRIILPHHSNHNDDPQHWPDKFRVQRFPEAA